MEFKLNIDNRFLSQDGDAGKMIMWSHGPLRRHVMCLITEVNITDEVATLIPVHTDNVPSVYELEERNFVIFSNAL